MSRKKKIIAILMLIVSSIIFAVTYDSGYGHYTSEERTDLNTEFSLFKTTTTESVQLLRFSTRNYPIVRATLFVYSDKNTVNTKVSDPNMFHGAVSIPENIGDTETDPGGVTIQTINTDRPQGVKENGAYHYWIEVTYSASGSDVRGRTSQLDIINENGLIAQIKNYYVQDLVEEFIRPNPSSSPRYLERQNGNLLLEAKANLLLEAKAKSGQVKGVFVRNNLGNTTKANIYEGSVGYNTEFIADTGTTEYTPILEGKFEITANINGVSTTLSKSIDSDADSLNFLKEDSSLGTGWYRAGVAIPFPESWKTAKISNIKAYFTARDKYGWGDKIELVIDGIVEKDPPIITNITTTNNTLKSFINTLLPSNDNSGFYTKITTSTTGITDNNLVGSLLNVKNNDNVDIQFTVDDENITSSKGNLSVTYNGITYSYVDGVKGSNSIEYIGISGTKTTWKLTVPNYKTDLNVTSFNIIDGSLSPNTMDSSNSRLTLFTEPSVLENTIINSNTNLAGTTLYPDYYNSKTIGVDTNGTSEAIAYMVVYDLDKSKSDLGLTDKLEGEWQGVLKTVPTLIFPSDGEYKYAKIYTINKAGAIKGITDDNINTFESIKKSIISKEKDNTFYIDTIAPRVPTYEFYKYEDKNKASITGISSEATTLYNSLLIGLNKPYKTDDGIEIKATVKEYNMAQTTDTTGIATWNVIPTSGTYDITNGALYEKKGTAIDLNGTSVTGKDTSKSISSTFYDKAGNYYTIPTSVNITFDDRKPSALTALPMVTGENLKFTNNTGIPLNKIDTITNPTLSIAVVNDSSVTNVTTAGSSNINLTSFLPSIVINKNNANTFDILTYSSSGEEGTKTSDSIVLDTEINDGQGSVINSNYTTEGSYNVFNLNTLLDSVTELVGLKTFIVTKTGTGNNTKISDAGTEKALGAVVSLEDYSTYNEILTPTIYSVLSPARLYKLKVPKGITGRFTYRITLSDRLGNLKNISYTVVVTNNVNIIGKVKNSSNTINTKISNGNKIKIESRAE